MSWAVSTDDAVREVLQKQAPRYRTCSEITNEARLIPGANPRMSEGGVRAACVRLQTAALADLRPTSPTAWRWHLTLSMVREVLRANGASLITPSQMASLPALRGYSEVSIQTEADILVSLGEASKLDASPPSYAWTSSPTAPPPPRPPRPAPTSTARPAPSYRPPPTTPAPPPQPPAFVSRQEARPNGKVYHTRELSEGKHDVDVIRQCQEEGKFVLLKGLPGGGKSALIEAALKDVITIQGDVDTSTIEFFGDYGEIPGDVPPEDAWNEGPAVIAALEKRPLFIDDISLIQPGVLSALYPAMDGRGWMQAKSRPKSLEGGRIIPCQGIFIVAAYNPLAPGGQMSDALKSRFKMHLEVETDLDLVREQMGVDPESQIYKVVHNMKTRYDSGNAVWFPQVRDIENALGMVPIIGEKLAIANMVGAAPDEAQEDMLEVARTITGDDELRPLKNGDK